MPAEPAGGGRRGGGGGVGAAGAPGAAGDPGRPFDAGVAGGGETTGEGGERDAAGGADPEACPVLDGTLDLVGAVLDHEAPYALIPDEDVGAGAEDEYGDSMALCQGIGAAKLVLGAGREVGVSGPADAEGDVAGKRFIQADGAEGAELAQEFGVHCGAPSSSRISGPAASTSPAPTVKKTSPGRSSPAMVWAASRTPPA